MMAFKGAAGIVRAPMHLMSIRRGIAQRGGVHTTSYIDEWHTATVKPAWFYDSQSAPGQKRKNYFYSVDLQGRVFLEEVLPKNIATSLKNEKFLDFFFRRMKRTKRRERTVLDEIGSDFGFQSLADEYPFVSPCGAELNFVRPADTVIVFHSMREAVSGARELMFGATLTQPFSPRRLLISKRTGRIYHELITEHDLEKPEEERSLLDKKPGMDYKPKITPLHSSGDEEFGLIRSSLAVSLSDGIVDGGETSSDKYLSSFMGRQYSGLDFVCPQTGRRYPIAWLPDKAEPGSWALPYHEASDE